MEPQTFRSVEQWGSFCGAMSLNWVSPALGVAAEEATGDEAIGCGQAGIVHIPGGNHRWRKVLKRKIVGLFQAMFLVPLERYINLILTW